MTPIPSISRCLFQHSLKDLADKSRCRCPSCFLEKKKASPWINTPSHVPQHNSLKVLGSRSLGTVANVIVSGIDASIPIASSLLTLFYWHARMDDKGVLASALATNDQMRNQERHGRRIANQNEDKDPKCLLG
jgi:hypothetical protein